VTVKRWHASFDAARLAVPGAARPPLNICDGCGSWLASVLHAAGGPGVQPAVFGMPRHGRRRRVFPDQCQLCRLPILAEAALLRFDAGRQSPRGPQALLCPSCDGWFTSLASDLRSARGLVDRTIDGPYGESLHPVVGPVPVAIHVADADTLELVTTVCRRMGAVIADSEEDTPAQVTIVELRGEPDARALAPAGERVVALVPYHLRAMLPTLAGAKVADWITLPATPQQLAHSVALTVRPQPVPALDPRTALPVAPALEAGTPVLAAVIPPSGDHSTVAWLLKRFARGYDEVVVDLTGRILVVPRCDQSQLPSVARRLTALLDGVAAVTPVEILPRKRLDLTG
jgi:hypothetical protein